MEPVQLPCDISDGLEVPITTWKLTSLRSFVIPPMLGHSKQVALLKELGTELVKSDLTFLISFIVPSKLTGDRNSA